MHQGEARGVPQLVDEVPVALHPLFGQLDVAPLGGESRQGEAERVGAVALDDLQGVDDVAVGLAHLLALVVAHQGVDVDVPEGHVAHELQAHHHHARHPEEEDVEAGHEHRGRVKGLEQRGRSGHPRVEKGQSAELNQVSRTSSSWTRCMPPHFGQAGGACMATATSPHPSQVQAGIWWPHQIWREMHQSRMFSIQSK